MRIVLLVITTQLYASNLCAIPRPALDLTIIPTASSKVGPHIELYGRDSIFYVVLRNRSKNSIKIWKESNSWGYLNLKLEIEDSAGNKLVVSKKRRGWNKNYPVTYLIEPGGYYVFRVAMIEGLWTNSSSMLPSARENKKLKMSAIYSISKTKDSDRLNVWVGKVKSKKQIFHVFR